MSLCQNQQCMKCTIKTCKLNPFPSLVNSKSDLMDNLSSLISVISDSLCTGSIPAVFKPTIIKLLLILFFNLSWHWKFKEYRPVFNLPFLSKVTEKIKITFCNSPNIFKTILCWSASVHSLEKGTSAVFPNCPGQFLRHAYKAWQCSVWQVAFNGAMGVFTEYSQTPDERPPLFKITFF